MELYCFDNVKWINAYYTDIALVKFYGAFQTKFCGCGNLFLRFKRIEVITEVIFYQKQK